MRLAFPLHIPSKSKFNLVRLSSSTGVFFRYHRLSPTHLISRLTSRNLHLLALRISSYLSLPPDNVLKHWASAKILKSKPTATGSGKDAELAADEDVCRSIVEKFDKLGGGNVSYADIAKRAWEAGRAGLATMVVTSNPWWSHDVIDGILLSFWTMRPERQTKSRYFS